MSKSQPVIEIVQFWSSHTQKFGYLVRSEPSYLSDDDTGAPVVCQSFEAMVGELRRTFADRILPDLPDEHR